MLWLDLQPYQKRGAGCSKPALKSSQVKALLEQYFANHTRDFTDKQKKRMKERPYAEMWNEVKALDAPRLRPPGGRCRAASRGHAARTAGYSRARASGCLARAGVLRRSFLEQSEEWEDPAAREAKRARYVQGGHA